MDDLSSLASSAQRNGRPAPRGMEVRDRRFGLPALRRIVSTWGERLRFRRELARKLTRTPHLIEDIGLTRPEAEAEIAKPFWRE